MTHFGILATEELEIHIGFELSQDGNRAEYHLYKL